MPFVKCLLGFAEVPYQVPPWSLPVAPRMPKNKPKEAYLVPAPKARLYPKVLIAKCLPGGAEGPYQGQPLSPRKVKTKKRTWYQVGRHVWVQGTFGKCRSYSFSIHAWNYLASNCLSWLQFLSFRGFLNLIRITVSVFLVSFFQNAVSGNNFLSQKFFLEFSVNFSFFLFLSFWIKKCNVFRKESFCLTSGFCLSPEVISLKLSPLFICKIL